MTGSRRLAAQRGFTIVEVMVAAFLLLGGVLAVFAIFISNSKATSSATRVEVAMQFAERDLEWMLSIPYECLYMDGIPVNAEEPSPNSRVSDGRLQVGEGEDGERLIPRPADDSACTSRGGSLSDWAGIPHGPTSFTVGHGASAVTGKVYRYATWRDERCPIIDLGELGDSVDGQLATLEGEIAEITARLATAVDRLAPVSPAIDSALAGIQHSLERLEAITSPSEAVSRVEPLRDALPGVIALLEDGEAAIPGVTTLLSRFQSLESSLATLREQLGTGSLTGTIDLCNLPDDLTGLADLEELTGLDLSDLVDIDVEDISVDVPGLDVLPSGLGELESNANQAVEGIEEHVDVINGLIDELLGISCTTSPSLCEEYLEAITAEVNAALATIADASDSADPEAALTTLQSLIDRIANLGDLTALDEELSPRIESIEVAVASLLSVAEQIALGEPTDENTKRILVAVVIDGERGDIAPREGVWLQSVMIDPDDGLL